MNQILQSNAQTLNATKQKQEKKSHFFKIQFLFSSILAVICLIFYGYFYISSNKEEIISQKLMNNFNISRLYSNTETNNLQTPVVELPITNYEISQKKFTVLGLIEIPSISIIYPILSNIEDEFLKIAPCKFYGSNPNEPGNLCIAGHNYENNKFFSRIRELNNNTSIFIYDSIGNKVEYLVYSKYETAENDLSCAEQPNDLSREITLVTCNNVTGNRIIVKAKESNNI